MSGPTRIDVMAATPTVLPAHDLTRSIALEDPLEWLCPVCGKLRVFEGGRPLGFGHQDECQKCGSPLPAPPTRHSPIRVSNLAW